MKNLQIVTKFCGESIGPDNVITIFVGEDDFAQRTKLEQKSIILIGCQNSGKSEIIDAFCNLFYEITFDSLIRYKIANERFDSSLNKDQIKIIKYVFYGTKYSFIPVIIDIPDIQSQTSTFPLLQQFLNYDQNAQIHALVIILPSNISSFNPQIQNEYSKLLSLFNPALKESCLLIINNNKDMETYSSNFLLQQFGIIPFKKFYTNTSSLFVKPSLDATIRERQKQYFDLTVQNLSLLSFYLGILSPQFIARPSLPFQQQHASVLDNSLHQSFQSLPSQQQLRPASIVQNRIPPTILENVSTTSSSLESSDISATQFRTHLQKPERRFEEKETNQNVIKDSYLSEHAFDPPRSQLIHSAVLIPEIHRDPNANRQNKQYLYDPETRIYQMFYGHHVPQPAKTVFPVLESNKFQKTDVREEMAKILRRGSFEDVEGTPTDSSEDSSEIIQRGGVESARSTASNWQYTPSSHGTIDKLQHASTYIDGSSEQRPLIINASATPSQVEGYGNLEILKYQDPPKPGRVVDPKFEKNEEQKNFHRSPFRQTRRQLPYSHEIKSYPPKDVEIYLPQKPLLTTVYPKPSKQITFQMDENTNDRSSLGNFDDSKCCFYILAPIFIICAIIAVIVVTIILSGH